MTRLVQDGRLLRVEGPGVLWVTSDLHGNLRDLERLAELMQSEPGSALLSLGDLVHGPSISEAEWAAEYSHLGDHYQDQSAALFHRWLALVEAHPGRVAALLGNHEHGHVGGPALPKFHPDEAGALEATLTAPERAALRGWIEGLPLIAVASNGVAFTHGAPPGLPYDKALLDETPLRGYEALSLLEMYDAGFLAELLWRRSSAEADVRAFLGRLDGFSGMPAARVVVYGHDVVREGFYVEHPALLCLSTSYGMRRAQKTCLRLELDRTIGSAEDLRPGVELVPLYPDQGR